MFKFAAKKVWVNNDDDIDQLSLSDSGDDEDLGGALGDEELAPISEMAELPPPPPAPSSGGFFNSISSLFSSSSRAPASETTAASIFDDDAAPPMMETMAAPARLRVAAAAPAPPVRPTPRLRKPPRHEEYRSVDTNVFAVALGTLASDAHVLTGDPVICSNCRAAYSQISRAVDNGSGAQCWTCEFCGHAQEVDIAEEERPTEQTSDYLLEPPTSASSEDQLIVFVLDVSGSMCVSSEVQGKIQLRGDHLEKLQRELQQDNGQQWMPGQNRDVTYISRLQGAQAAISQQINALKREHPRSRVALITFASDVTIVGDGSADAITVAGDRLNDFDQLLALGQNVSVAHTIADSHESLDGIIWELQEGGATALGPAATIAVGLASKTPAAKIILCTDGLANVGVGALEEAATPAQKAASRQWYEKLSDIARGFGSSISVVSIAGSGCCMEYLGILADQTSGKVDIVDPLTLTTNFASLLSQPTIASQVTATLLLHKALFIRSGTLETNIAIKEIGNVQANSEVTFEFGVRKDYVAGMRRAAAAAAAAATASQSKIPSAAPVPQPGDAPVPCTDDASSSSSSAASSSSSSSAASSSSSTPAAALPSEVPFQVQVTFRRLDGSKYMRVVTALQPISFDREEVEEDIDMDVLGRNVIQQCADMAHAGEYERAKLHGVANRRFFQKKAKAPHQQKQVADIISVQRQLEGAVRDELKSDDYFGSAVPSYSAAAPSAEVKERRRARRTEADANSNVLYQMKSHSRSPF